MIRKFAKADILDVRYSSNKLSTEQLGDGFSKLAKPSPVTDDGYLYVTVRAISSRVNKNDDGWPSIELARTDPGYGYRTFEGRPIFIDHNNDNPDRTRGVVVRSKLHVDDEKKAASLDPYYASAPAEHMPPTWVELMLEVDAKEYPKLAKAIINEDVDSVSMGANIDLSKCSVCGHEAENPTEYCSHVQMKGATFEVTSENGEKTHKKAYEDCYGINFFEISFVFDPADETALISDMSPERKAAITAIAALESAGASVPVELRKQAAGPLFPAEPEPEPAPYDYAEGEKEFAEEPVDRGGEEERVNAWRYEQFVSLGLSGEEAQAAIASGLDWHDLANFLQEHPGATAEQALRIMSKQKEAIGPPGKDHHNLDQHRQDAERDRQMNHEPQADKMTAPEDVQTLRPEVICKNCGSTVDPDSAGQLICQECGYEVEPEGLDNPDLEMAKDIDIRQDKTEESNPEGEMETELEHDKGETEVPAKSPVRPVAPISSTQSDPVKDEMKFSTIDQKVKNADPAMVRGVVAFMEGMNVEVEDEIELARIVSEADNFKGEPTIYETAAAIEVIASKTAAVTDNADSKSETKVNTDKDRPVNSAATQTASEKVISDQLAPIESKTIKEAPGKEHMKGVSPKRNRQYEHVLETCKKDHPDYSEDRCKELAARTVNKERSEKGETKSNVNFEVLAETESEETSNEVTDMENEKTADRETIKRVEEDGSGVKRTEEITKEFGPMAESGEPAEGEEAAEGEESEAEGEAEAEAPGEESELPAAPEAEADAEEVKAEDAESADEEHDHNPLNEEEKVPAMASTEEGKLLAALKLAKKASSLGVIEADAELEYAGELEQSESLAEIEARSKMLEQVKDAGLARKRHPVVAGRIPSFKSAGTLVNDVDDADDAGLFL